VSGTKLLIHFGKNYMEVKHYMKNQQNRQFEPKQTVQKEDGSTIVNLEVYEVFADGFLNAENE
jgi:hypothetical protein